MLIAAGIAVVFYAAGRSVPLRRRSTPPGADPGAPLCSCTHGLAYHDPTTGVCHAQVKDQPTVLNRHETPIAWSMVQCSCRQYVGPVPTEQLLAYFNPLPPSTVTERHAADSARPGRDEHENKAE
jgi:hypothetical protein